MSDRAQIAALGARFDRERPRLAFDGCMRMHFEQHPPVNVSPRRSNVSAIADALAAIVAFQRAMASLKGEQ